MIQLLRSGMFGPFANMPLIGEQGPLMAAANEIAGRFGAPDGVGSLPAPTASAPSEPTPRLANKMNPQGMSQEEFMSRANPDAQKKREFAPWENAFRGIGAGFSGFGGQ